MDWKTILTSLVTSSVVTLIISTLIKGGIGFYYSRKLEDFKKDLSTLLEYEKFDFQRRIHDFSLYSSQRHIVYPELYKLIITTFNNIRYSNYCPVTNEKTMRESYLVNLLREKRYKEEQIEKYLIMWRENPTSVFDILEDVFIRKDAAEISKGNEKLFEYFNLNELFLSDKLSQIVDETVANLTQLSAEVPHILFYNNSHDLELTEAMIREINNQVQHIKSIIKDELSIADYQKGNDNGS